ncbi:MAG TPA: hypothetical protein VIJ27_05875 [Mucilaginibacter sp.]
MDKEKKEQSEWAKLRLVLNQQYTLDRNWEVAIELFRNRFLNKFFNPIEQLIKIDTIKGEGFTIVTIQCALIEAFASMRKGLIFEHDAPKGSPKFIYNNSKKLFVEFLSSEQIFKGHFWTTDPTIQGKKNANTPYNAESFYQDVRCGLMHEARTKGNWIISANHFHPKMMTESQFIKSHSNGQQIMIYRTVLHYRLKEYLAIYCNELREQNKNLRRFLARKLDHIFDHPRDAANFDWWVDR